MTFSGFWLRKLLGWFPAQRGRISVDKIAGHLARIVFSWSTPANSDDFMRRFEIENEVNFRRVFDEEIFYLHLWTMDTCIQLAFCKKRVLLDNLMNKFYGAIVNRQARIPDMSIASMFNNVKRWENRKEKYDEVFHEGNGTNVDKIPMWFFDYVLNEGLGGFRKNIVYQKTVRTS